MTAAVEDESLPWAAAWQRKEAEKIQELENSKKDSIHTCEAAGLPGYNDYETWLAKERLLVPVIQERAVCDKPRAYPEAGRKALERKRLDEVGRRTVLLLESVRREVTVDEELDMEAYRASRRRFKSWRRLWPEGGLGWRRSRRSCSSGSAGGRSRRCSGTSRRRSRSRGR